MVMEIIYYELNSILQEPLPESVSAIGFFDGIHRGHQQLLMKSIEVAKEKGLKSSMITFSPSPASILAKQEESLLTTVAERIEVAQTMGIDQFIVLKFTKSLSQLNTDDFHNLIIKTLNIRHLVCGEDFRYGFKGSGSTETLKQVDNLGLSVIYDYKYNDIRISSTLIKKEVQEGDLQFANELLGYPYFIKGFVKHGRKVGRTIGFPTINLQYELSKYLIKDGVYVGYTTIKGKNYISTINVGHNPTVNTVEKKSIESFVHDFDEDVYQHRVTFHFLKLLRPEIKFESVEALIEQMNKDIESSEQYFTEDKRRSYDIEII